VVASSGLQLQKRKELHVAKKKRYEVKAICPNCACGTPSHLTIDEIKAKVIDGENLEVNCPECMEVYRANIKQACPDYAKDCKLEY
jgi:hypothetical protein